MQWRDQYDLPRRLGGHVPAVVVEIGVALMMIGLAIGARLILNLAFKGVVPFALIFPAVVGATLLAGARAGAVALAGCQILTWYFVLPIENSFRFANPGNAVSLIVTTLAELLLLWSVAGYRSAVHRTAELEQRRADGLAMALRELDHRTRNNFQLASGLLHIHAARQADEHVRMELKAAAQRLMSIAAVHRKLSFVGDDLSHVALNGYLEELCAGLRAGVVRGGVTLDVEAAAIEVSRELALHIGLIVNELVTNALKHAFPEGSGHIAVTVRREAGLLALTVIDDGAGTTAAAPNGNGIGAELTRLLADRIGARLDRLPGPGTGYRLEIPPEREPGMGAPD